MSVKAQLSKLKSEIPSEVLLVAVSKTKPNELLREAYENGQRDFGENYVQELVDKEAVLPKDIRWHFIGHLQSNKIKFLIPFVHLIHGVDSFKLLQEINKQALKQNKKVNCLLQIYIAQEDTKFGLSFEEAEELLTSEAFANLNQVNVIGFMGMASNTANSEQVRKEFGSLKAFQSKLINRFPFLQVLSFGMSNDYKIAIEEGSTLVRIGSLVFGERIYS